MCFSYHLNFTIRLATIQMMEELILENYESIYNKLEFSDAK